MRFISNVTFLRVSLSPPVISHLKYWSSSVSAAAETTVFKTHRLDANYTLGQRFGIHPHTHMSEIPIGAGVNYFCVASSSFAIVIILSFCAFKNTNTSGDENATDRRM